MILDLDRFKEVNDTLGHHQRRRAAARRRRAPRPRCCAPSDTVARLGGDEFAVLLPCRVTTADAVAAVAERIRDALEPPFALDGLSVDVGASIGIASAPSTAATPRR